MTTAQEALGRMMAGNRRFTSGRGGQGMAVDREGLRELAAGQQPMAAVLACADSRVPVELIFDQRPGELFVIRVAGNIAASTQLGSLEFAVQQLGTQLVMVLGHTGCGAVQAALDDLRQDAGDLPPNLRAVVDQVRPSLEGLLGTELQRDPDALAREAVRAHVLAVVAGLPAESELLGRELASGRLGIVGAEYALETGAVDVFHGLPAGG